MNNVNYLEFGEIEPADFLPLLNSQKLRQHLIEHDLFTADSLSAWINSKIEVDSISGCRVRGIVFEGELAGWCGIQLEEEKYEIAIIIDDKFWGLGKEVFQDMIRWAKEFDHDEVNINFLHTRPEYKFLKKIATSVTETELYGSKFICYQLAVK